MHSVPFLIQVSASKRVSKNKVDPGTLVRAGKWPWSPLGLGWSAELNIIFCKGGLAKIYILSRNPESNKIICP
jgi:hypothetical protein